MEHRNENIIETFDEIFTLAPQLIQKIREICATSEHTAISQVPTLNGQMGNLKINANINANADNGLMSNERVDNQTDEQSNDDTNKQFAHIATPINPINLLSQPNVTIPPIQWSIILTTANNILPDKTRILKETRHDSWICVRQAKERKKPIAEIYCANPEFSLSGFVDMKAIDNTFNVPNIEFRLKRSFQTDSQVDQFNVVFAYALCFSMNQPLENVNNGLRKNIDNVRQLIVQTLLNGEFPSDARNIWLQPMAVERVENRSVDESSVRVDMSVGPILYDQMGQPSGESTTFETSATDRDVIKLLLQANALLRQEQLIVVEAAHRLCSKIIRIVRTRVDGSWACVYKSEQKVYVYHLKYSQLSDESRNKVTEWYGESGDPFPNLEYKPILQNVALENEFLFTVATALYIGMDRRIEDIDSCLFKELSIEDVRETVVKLLLDGVPLSVADATIWKRS